MGHEQVHLFEGFTLDIGRGCLLRDGEEVHLRPQSYEVLKYLVENNGRLVSKDRLIEAVWRGRAVTDGSLGKCIEEMREALGENARQYVRNVRGRGYIFDLEVSGGGKPATRTVETEQIDLISLVVEEEEDTEGGDEVYVTAFKPDKQVAHPDLRLRTKTNKTAAALWTAGVSGVVLLALLTYQFSRPVPERSAPATVTEVRSLAVLPFKPLVSESRDESLEMGMTDTLIARFSNSRKIVVRPLGSVRKYGDLRQDPLVAGRELNVESVLDGSIQRSGDNIRVNVRLVSVADGAALWVGTFDEKFTDIFAVQDAISGRVAGALALHLSGEEERRLTKRHTGNAAAYELYLKGRYHLFKLTPTDVRKGIELFQEAVAVDPAYALAYTGIADAYRTLPITSDVAPKDAFPKAKEAVTKALELDDSLAEAHAILGWIKFWFDWDWAGSESEFRRAIELNPNNADAHRGYAHLLSNTGRHEEALREVERARELDPLSLITNTLQGQFLHFAGRDDEAVRRFEIALELNPNFWVAHVNLANVFIRKKMYEPALAELAKAREQSGGNTMTISLTGYVLALSGERERARVLLEELRRLSMQRYVPPYNLAVVHHGLGEREEALAWLERAYEERDVLLTFAAVDRKWDALRSDQRFVSLLKRMKLHK